MRQTQRGAGRCGEVRCRGAACAVAAALVGAVLVLRRSSAATQSAGGSTLRVLELQAAQGGDYRRAAELKWQQRLRSELAQQTLGGSPTPPARPQTPPPGTPPPGTPSPGTPQPLAPPSGALPAAGACGEGEPQCATQAPAGSDCPALAAGRLLIVFVVAHHLVGSAAIRGYLLADAVERAALGGGRILPVVHSDAPTSVSGAPSTSEHNNTGLGTLLREFGGRKVCWFVKGLPAAAAAVCRVEGALVAWDGVDNEESMLWARSSTAAPAPDLFVLQTKYAAQRYSSAARRAAVVPHHHTQMSAWRPPPPTRSAPGEPAVVLLAGYWTSLPDWKTASVLAVAVCAAGGVFSIWLQKGLPQHGALRLAWDCAAPERGPQCCVTQRWPECTGVLPECSFGKAQPAPPGGAPDGCAELQPEEARRFGPEAYRRQRDSHWFPGLEKVAVGLLWPPNLSEFTVRWRPATRLFWWWAKGIPTVFFPYESYLDAAQAHNYRLGGEVPVAGSAAQAVPLLRRLLHRGPEWDCLSRAGLAAARSYAVLPTAHRVVDALCPLLAGAGSAPPAPRPPLPPALQGGPLPMPGTPPRGPRDCSPQFQRYSPSAWETEWSQGAAGYAHSFTCRGADASALCRAMRKDAAAGRHPALHSYIEAAARGSVPPGHTGEHLVSRIHFRVPQGCPAEGEFWYPIEPLVSFLRRSDCLCIPEQRQRSCIADKGWLLLPSPPHAHFAAAPEGRLLIFDVGSSSWTAGKGGPSLSWLVDHFSRISGRLPERVLAWEATPADPAAWWTAVPDKVRHAVTFYNTPATSVPGSGSNPLAVLAAIARAADFVVLKLDIDHPRLEMELMEQLMGTPALIALLDELFWEHHVAGTPMHCPELWCTGHPGCARQGWGTGVSGSLEDTYRILTQLRRGGVRAHSWV